MTLVAMSDGWDVAAFALTVVGFVLTVASLWYAIVQLRKTASVAEAAKVAAEQTLTESRRGFQRYALAIVLRYVNELRLYVERKDWSQAAIRASDLADQAAQLANLAQDWQRFAPELRGWAADFARFASGTVPKYSTKKWKDLVQQLQGILDVSHGPFTSS